MSQTSEEAGSLESSGRLLTAWYRLPVAVRAFLSGAVVFYVLQGGWVLAFLANREIAPEIPWNVPVGLLYLWVVLRYFDGRGWPASTSAARHDALRARELSREQWAWSLVYCFLSLVFMASVINVIYRFIPVPEAAQTDVSVFPWWSLYPTLIMLSINAGVSEEAGFRGYLQGGLERRYGPAPAIAVTSIIFWLAHLNHPTGASRWALLIGYGVLLGALTWAARSIWPAIVTHATIDAVSFTTVASGFGPDYFMKKPELFAETGIDPPFVVFSILLVGSTVAGIGILRRLRRN